MSQSQAALLCCQEEREGKKNTISIELCVTKPEKRAVTNIMPLRSISGACQLCGGPATGERESREVSGTEGRENKKDGNFFRNTGEQNLNSSHSHIIGRGNLVLSKIKSLCTVSCFFFI